ncbi:hypothetical protein [Streptomyces sp. 8N616]|uniref:hypothetical protein n=1 Tax=Streptomyces sp. 8N616 TaxID=3457414 RepID=UPI003FD64257
MPTPPRGLADTGTFHAALRGLHLSATRPDPDTIRKASHGLLSVEDVTGLLSGSRIGDWKTVDRLVHALHGRPADIQPLWHAARIPAPSSTTTGPARPWHAEHFG